MYQRTFRSEPGRLVFTRDYRELLRGEFRPGRPCSLFYDAARIIPADEPPGARRPQVVAQARFRPEGEIVSLPLVSPERAADRPSPAVPAAPDAARMLRGELQVPEDAEWVMLWFYYCAADDTVRYDSDFGRNFTFRFDHDQVVTLATGVGVGPNHTQQMFWCRMAADLVVDALAVRYRVLANHVEPEREFQVTLTRTPEQTGNGQVVWVLENAPVPAGAGIVYELLYSVGEQRYKDDNHGRYFLVAPEHSWVRLAS